MRMLNLIATTALATFVAGMTMAQQIGVVASLDPSMRATAPGQSERTLAIRAGVVANDSIRTEPTARGQLLFQDETTLSVAPASQIVLDRFVYDPNGGSSGFGMQLTTGALRFVGGTTSEAQEATITTPTATLGIRGSSALVSHTGGRTTAIFLMGDRMCITARGQRTCTSRQGGVLTEDGYAGRASPQVVANLLTRIDGQPPQLRRRTADAGVRTSTSPGQLPISTRGMVLGTADTDGFARIDRDRGLINSPLDFIDEDFLGLDTFKANR